MYHFVGIKGSGMSALAQIMHKLGYKVEGSDIEKHFFRSLTAMGIPVELAANRMGDEKEKSR